MTNTDSTVAGIAAWFGQRLPQEWVATSAPKVVVDREEITVVLTLPAPDAPQDIPQDGPQDRPADTRQDDAAAAERAEQVAGRVARFREETRGQRIGIAREAEHRFGRKVAWGVECGGRRELFTHLAVPVMARLRQPERQVLDTLVDAGVARSRAHALAWCVRLVGDNAETWLADLRNAMEHVERVREAGPGAKG